MTRTLAALLLLSSPSREATPYPAGVVLHAAPTCKSIQAGARSDELVGEVTDTAGRRLNTFQLRMMPLRTADGGVVGGEPPRELTHANNGTFALFNGVNPDPRVLTWVLVDAPGFAPQRFSFSGGASGCLQVVLAAAPDGGVAR